MTVRYALGSKRRVNSLRLGREIATAEEKKGDTAAGDDEGFIKQTT
jgi:hypothetical protein